MKLPAHKKMLSAAAAASVLLITAACGSSESDGASTTDTATSAAPSDDAATDSTDDSASGDFADGDYSGEGSYSNPGGESTVKVDLTLADGKVSDVTVTPEATNGTSKQYQEQFAGGIADQVVGKGLDEIEVSKVAGSSLTSGGFNQAIDAIKAEAQA
ncbi:FMN-binding protein [Aeromicrobium stalagmiti]|uniref:FMN-binding protein n=1 Tax=Aeromicrobium stalagmiti TaxID=2738988 RepID=UPI001569F677|nr:FMN-binding protein [Aeromicrobium stalagmiti]NRQ48690.1 FMN-binding protein [Aeromicrobium stalagmiti]